MPVEYSTSMTFGHKMKNITAIRIRKATKSELSYMICELQFSIWQILLHFLSIVAAKWAMAFTLRHGILKITYSMPPPYLPSCKTPCQLCHSAVPSV